MLPAICENAVAEVAAVASQSAPAPAPAAGAAAGGTSTSSSRSLRRALQQLPTPMRRSTVRHVPSSSGTPSRTVKGPEPWALPDPSAPAAANATSDYREKLQARGRRAIERSLALKGSGGGGGAPVAGELSDLAPDAYAAAAGCAPPVFVVFPGGADVSGCTFGPPGAAAAVPAAAPWELPGCGMAMQPAWESWDCGAMPVPMMMQPVDGSVQIMGHVDSPGWCQAAAGVSSEGLAGALLAERLRAAAPQSYED